MESSSLKRLGTRSLAITSSAAMLVGLTAAGAAAAPAAPQDVDLEAPNLVSFEVSAEEVNLDAGETTITVTAKITDTTGVDVTTKDGDAAGPVIVAKSTNSNHSTGPVLLNLVAGTTQDGTYTGTLTLPEGSADGQWDISLVTLGDTLNNDVVPADAGILDSFAVRYFQVVELTAEYDFFQDEAGTDNDSFTIPDLEGVEFRVDGAIVAPGRYTGQAEGTVDIVATATGDYQFSKDLGIRDEDSGDYVSEGLVSLSETEATWTHDFNMVTPADVKFIDRSGSEGDAYVIPDVEGVSYYLAPITEGEQPLEAGENSSFGTVNIQAVADEGYELVDGAQTEWPYTFSTDYSQVVEGDVAISGDAQVNETLTAVTEDDADTTPEWGPEAGVEFSYQWFAQDVPAENEEPTAPEAIEGATAATFTPSLDQLGQTITVEVTGSLDGYDSSEAVSSMSTDAVAEGYLTAATPAINGEANVGETLEADAGEWGEDGVELAYQWKADGEAIEGATESTLELTEENLGQRISVTVTGSLENYKDTSVTSAVTAEVAEAEARFSDNQDEDRWYYAPINWMVDEDITQGYEDGTFRPYQEVTRAEAVSFLYRYTKPDFEVPSESSFPDVPVGHNHFDSISWATETGVVKGYEDGTFKPTQDMTRGEVATILYRQANPDFTAPEESPFKDIEPGGTYYEAITWMESLEITEGYSTGNFGVYDEVSRGEIATFLYRLENSTK